MVAAATTPTLVRVAAFGMGRFASAATAADTIDAWRASALELAYPPARDPADVAVRTLWLLMTQAMPSTASEKPKMSMQSGGMFWMSLASRMIRAA